MFQIKIVLIFHLLQFRWYIFLTGVQLTFGSILGFKNMSYIGALSILAGSQALSLGLLSEIIVNLSERAEGSQVSIKEILKKNGAEYPLNKLIA